MTRRTRNFLRLTLGMVVPHTAVVAAKALANRRRRPVIARKHVAAGAPRRRPFSYAEAESVLTGRGVALEVIRTGSIGPAQLRFVAEVIAGQAPADRPLRVVHIGNFLGVSLAGLSDAVAGHDPRSRIVSIDPNVAHMGVHDPQSHVLALLDHFGLQGSNVVIRGYSLTRPLAHDGAQAGENALLSLENLGQRFDIAFVDGNHDAGYVRAELEVLARLVDDGGLLILDDVSQTYREIRTLFQEVDAGDAWPLDAVAHDGLRIGVLRKRGSPTSYSP
jgi:predicted O-methyltransferase YrrM